MPVISVTRLRIRKLRFVPPFLLHTWKARQQVRRAPGFRGGALLRDRGWTFWTLTAWESQADMRHYMTSGAHHLAMPHLLEWCDQACVAHWVQEEDELPGFEEADRHLRARGRPSKIRHPSPDHGPMTFRPPRLAAGDPIPPVITVR